MFGPSMDTRSCVSLWRWSFRTSLVSDSHLIGAVSPEKYRNNLDTPGDDFRSCFCILGSTAGYTSSCVSLRILWTIARFFPREGGPRIQQFIAPWGLKFLWSRKRSHSRRSRTVEQFMAPCLEYCAGLDEWSGPVPECECVARQCIHENASNSLFWLREGGRRILRSLCWGRVSLNATG